jgi:hypothetical protein
VLAPRNAAPDATESPLDQHRACLTKTGPYTRRERPDRTARNRTELNHAPPASIDDAKAKNARTSASPPNRTCLNQTRRTTLRPRTEPPPCQPYAAAPVTQPCSRATSPIRRVAELPHKTAPASPKLAAPVRCRTRHAALRNRTVPAKPYRTGAHRTRARLSTGIPRHHHQYRTCLT